MRTTKISELPRWKFSKNASEEFQFKNENETVFEFLKRKYFKGCSFGLDNLSKLGKYREAGWEIDFKSFMHQYWVNDYNDITQYYAPNKTMLRKIIYGKIAKIVRVY